MPLGGCPDDRETEARAARRRAAPPETDERQLCLLCAQAGSLVGDGQKRAAVSQRRLDRDPASAVALSVFDEICERPLERGTIAENAHGLDAGHGDSVNVAREFR